MKDVPVSIIITIFLFTISVSGCTEGGDIFSIFGLNVGPGEPVYTTYEDLKVNAEIIPSEIYEGQTATIFFDVYNTGNSTLHNINLEMTDLRGFSTSETSKHIDKLEEGDVESWNWKLDSSTMDVYENRNYVLRYKVDYESNSAAMYDIVVMSEDEYARLKRRGELENEVNLYYYKTKTPVEIDISLSDEQPFFEGSDFYFYLTLKNMGSGSISQIDTDELTVTYPSDIIEFTESNDFSKVEDGVLKLSKPVEFFDKKTKKLTCKFTVKHVDIKKVGQFSVEANYIYTYYKTINIKVKSK